MEIKLRITLLYILICQLIKVQLCEWSPVLVVKEISLRLTDHSQTDHSRLSVRTKSNVEIFIGKLSNLLNPWFRGYSIKRLLNNKNPILIPTFQFPFG